MYGVENRFKMQLLLGLKGSPLRHGNPTTKDYLKVNNLDEMGVQKGAVQQEGPSLKQRDFFGNPLGPRVAGQV